MRIGIDAKFLTHPQKGGFKTYTENLIQALAEVDKENEYILYVDRQPLDTDLIPNQPNFKSRVVPVRNSFYGMPWREQYSLPRQLRNDQLDVFHAPCNTAPIFIKIPTMVTIHDMIWYYPTRYSHQKIRLNRRKLMQWYNKFVPFIAAKRAKAVITVSNASKKSIIEYLRLAHDRVFVTYEAANGLTRPIVDDRSLSKITQYNFNSNHILGIGSADPRKNIKTLIRAYSLLPDNLRNSHCLTIVWNHNSLALELSEEAKKQDVMKSVYFLNNIDDEQLASLYHRAALFVFPSLEEGFGLPPLEAMACGTPVLAADNSSIPEIVGNAALMFSAENAVELANLITRVLTDSELQQKMRICGIERAAKFTWRDCALKTIDVYKSVR
ncbi:MAG: glycosyltransferase family 4 protein [Anaerolineales bacterium]